MGVAGKRARRSPSRPGFVDSTARGLSFAMSHGARKTEDDPAKWEAEAAVGERRGGRGGGGLRGRGGGGSTAGSVLPRGTRRRDNDLTMGAMAAVGPDRCPRRHLEPSKASPKVRAEWAHLTALGFTWDVVE